MGRNLGVKTIRIPLPTDKYVLTKIVKGKTSWSEFLMELIQQYKPEEFYVHRVSVALLELEDYYDKDLEKATLVEHNKSFLANLIRGDYDTADKELERMMLMFNRIKENRDKSDKFK